MAAFGFVFLLRGEKSHGRRLEESGETGRERGIQSLLAGEADEDKGSVPVIEGYEETKNLRTHKPQVRRVLWRLKASGRAATYISEKSTAVSTRVDGNG